MINYINKTKIDNDLVNNLLNKSELCNKYTNNGPLKKELEFLLKDYLKIEENKSCVCLCNGTAALKIAVLLSEIKKKK
jgi:dTDP-4-amino-4,6-dideoxygalactose transaminase